MSVPSVIFADDEGGAVWYGKLAGGVMLGGDEDGRYVDNGSRWGIKGSAEVADGLSAVYNFEASIDSSSATQPDGNRLSYMGLSGGFGNITMGRVWSAAYNNSGSMRYIGPYFGSGDTPGRIGNAVSYAFSSDAANVQVDAVMDSGTDTGKSIDEVQFGATINFGDIGKLGIGYRKVEDATTTMAVMGATPSTVSGENMLKLAVNAGSVDKTGSTVAFRTKDGRMLVGDPVVTHTITDGATGKSHVATLEVVHVKPGDKDGQIYKIGGKFYSAGCTKDSEGSALATGTDACAATTQTVRYVTANKMESKKGEDPSSATYMAYTPDATNGANLMNKGYVTRNSDWGGQRDNRGRNIDDMGYYIRWINNTEEAIGFIEIEVDDAEIPAERILNQPDVNASDDGSKTYYVKKDGSLIYVTLDNNTPNNMDDDQYVLISTDMVNDDGDIDIDNHGITGLSEKDVETALMAREESKDRTRMVSIKHTATGNLMDMDFGETSTHVTAQFNLGVATLALGYSETDSNDPKNAMKKETTFLGLNGSIGDTGLSWTANARNVEDHDGAESSPWGVSLSKSLGDSASAWIDHGNSDDGTGGATYVGMQVNF